ncbi:hypothetical protein J7T55_014608 [Diaporthe amygdali]|uniref:uncharacterized protein n=1 Tax=Phomopsis amygdali TaxID=1214568 RepID=UPI0022FDE850|nr:uncharacterized protein J7T55_014608 [Diaporthe amygdali]KAJ0118155.1 hypothetical protein J7T55_014608 [Diaporthe amygdali]
MSASDAKEVTSSVSKLSLDTNNAKKSAKPKPKKEPVADSWEDEDVSSDTETETEKDDNPTPSEGDPHGTSAPPPTPVTPSYGQGTFSSSDSPGGYHISTGSSGPPAARPEKTDAVARRMIAGALGMRAPKLTEEQKNYDKAVREKERKRREEEKAAQKRREEEATKAKAAMWDD